MNKHSVSLDEIAVKEHRHAKCATGILPGGHFRDFVCNITAQFVDSLENQGFTFDEVLDGLMNYAWVNTNSADAVCFLMQASLSLTKARIALEATDVTS